MIDPRLRNQEPELRRIAGDASKPPTDWLEPADKLLAEPDPGPTPFVVDELLVESAVGAVQGPHKVGKTWAVLELACAIVTGRCAFDRYEVPIAGPVVLILEESGRAALHRRLDSLRRGTAGVEVADLADLHFAANRRVRLDDARWQEAMIEAGEEIKPRAIFLDPLVRLKGASVDENVQKEMAPVLDFMRDLRDATGAAVVFVHHTGHDTTRLRGTSDLEAYWESKITVRRDESGICTLTSEHREAGAGRGLTYRLAWHEQSESMRLLPTDDPPAEQQRRDELVAYVREHPGESQSMVEKAVGGKRRDTASLMHDLERAQTLYRTRSQYEDAKGRARKRDGWFAAPQGSSHPVPTDGTHNDAQSADPASSLRVPPLIGRERDAVPVGTPSQVNEAAVLAAVDRAIEDGTLIEEPAE